MKVCSIEGCGREHCGRGFCSKHYQAFRTHGDPNHKRPRPSVREDGLKKCSRCKLLKVLEEFSRRTLNNRLNSWCKKCAARRQGDLYRNNPELRLRVNEGNIRRKYGLSPEGRKEMFEKQGGLCAICKQPETSKNMRLSVDHDHETGKIRGLLCSNCNTALGLLKESPGIAQAATDYLKSQASSDYSESCPLLAADPKSVNRAASC